MVFLDLCLFLLAPNSVALQGFEADGFWVGRALGGQWRALTLIFGEDGAYLWCELLTAVE